MKRIRKLVCIVCAAALALSFAACRQTAPEDSISEDTAQSAEITPAPEVTPAPEEDVLPTPAPEGEEAEETHRNVLPAPENGSEAFRKAFEVNPVDAQYASDLENAGSVANIIAACNAASESWREQIDSVLERLLYDFPICEICYKMPLWVTMLEKGHWLQQELYSGLLAQAEGMSRMQDAVLGEAALECPNVQMCRVVGMDLSCGVVTMELTLHQEVFYRILEECTGLEIGDEAGLVPCIVELARAKKAYDKVRSALEQTEATGYGIVMPSLEELALEEPEIIRQGGKYGVRLRASAPSIHMMKATIETEIAPIVGSERQSEDLVTGLLKDFENDPLKIWESNIFGKSLHELVNEGLQSKLLHMPQEARLRLQETVERVINEGCSGLVCIII